MTALQQGARARLPLPWFAAVIAFTGGVLFVFLLRPASLNPAKDLGLTPKNRTTGPVLLPLTEASRLGQICSPERTPSAFWQPTHGQVERFERALREGPRPDLQRSIRQYLGLVVDARSVLCINAGPAERHWDDPWKTQAIVVEDGGRAYWRALFDPTTDQLVGFNSNGSP